MPINEMPQANKQHAVPQNIMQVEFKIVGDLTMRQFFYLIMAAIFAFGLYRSGLPYIIRLPLALAMAGFGLAVAFVPFQDRSLDQWVVNFFAAVYTPTQRIWRKSNAPPSYFYYQKTDSIKASMLAVAPTASRRKLEQYLEQETGGGGDDTLDANEKEYIKKVKNAFIDEEEDTLSPVAIFNQIDKTTYAIPTTTIPVTTEEVGVQPTIDTPTPPLEPNTIATTSAQDVSVQTPTQTVTNNNIPTSNSLLNEPTAIPNTANQQTVSQTQTPIVAATPTPITASVQQSTPIPTPKPQTPNTAIDLTPRPKVKKKKKQNFEPLPSVTPDRLTGRRFTHLSAQEGEIILPIRGERVINTPEEKEIEIDINQKLGELNNLVKQVKIEHTENSESRYNISDKIQTPEITMIDLNSNTDNLINNTANNNLPPIVAPTPVVNIPEATNNINTNTQSEIEKARELELQKLLEEKAKAQKELEELKKKLEEAEKAKTLSMQQTIPQPVQPAPEQAPLSPPIPIVQPTPIVQQVMPKIEPRIEPVVQTTPVQPITYTPPTQPLVPNIQPLVQQPSRPAIEATYSKAPPITNLPNLISGIVKDNNLKLVEGAIVIIKDSQGDTVRALKTNKIGQFVITTPVLNGDYIIEVNKDSLVFDKIHIVAKGEVLPALEFTGNSI